MSISSVLWRAANPAVCQVMTLPPLGAGEPLQVWALPLALPPPPLQALQLSHDPLYFLPSISHGWGFLVWGFSDKGPPREGPIPHHSGA